MAKRPKKPRPMNPELAAELYDDGESLAGAMMAAEAAGMEFSDYITRHGPPPVKKSRQRKASARG